MTDRVVQWWQSDGGGGEDNELGGIDGPKLGYNHYTPWLLCRNLIWDGILKKTLVSLKM